MVKRDKGGRRQVLTLGELIRKQSSGIRRLLKVYNGLCVNGAENSTASFFADNFHPVIGHCVKRAGKSEREKYIEYDGGFSTAEAIIAKSSDEFPSTDEIIRIIRDCASERRISGSEIEYLGFSISYTLTELICSCVKTWDKELIRYMTLLSEVGGIDIDGINSVLNPVAIKLSADPAYSESDPKTKLEYREAIYATSYRYGIDELKLCDELLEKYRGESIDIESLAVFRSKKASGKTAIAAASLLAVGGIVISCLIGIYAEAKWCIPFLILPAIEALRPLSDRILYRKKGFTRLMRYDTGSEQVKSEKAAIVLSAQVTDADDAAELYSKLLRLYCLNPQDNILITALLDLSAEQVPITSEDRSVIDALSDVIERLEKIKPGKFSCIVRKRSFSETQQEYMGALRKRGAVMELAEYMKTGLGDFYAALGSYENLKGTDYICAADSDTIPLMDSVSELLGIALHPSNRVSVKNGMVTKGYGIIAPRMVTRLRDSLRSEFSKSLGGIGSRSSYDGEASSLYQDVFGRGTFCGKGLINVTALTEVTKCLDGERILSHDILEGELLRTAYAGDVCFTEGFPKSPQSYYRRLDRWIRGDFQNIPEIFSKKYDSISVLKLLDNLRRAITPVSVFLSFFAAFLLERPAGAIIAVSALALWLLPAFLGAIPAVIKDRALTRRFYSGIISSASQGLRYILYSIVMLPTLAIKSLRAIITALVRLFTKRNLLEWTTADSADRQGTLPLRYYMLPEVLSLTLLWSPDYLIRLFGAVFSMMPALLAINDGSTVREGGLKYRDAREISKQTADMWGFFEKYVTRRDNFLPPDNVQFAPVYRVAHRTSPTNIGLYMLSVLAAYDRKLISLTSLLTRLENTLSTVERLEKYKGNLYNWYDTETLKICEPEFISSVDSGNFTVCMVALKEGLKGLGARTQELSLRLSRIIDDTDLSVFYNPVRGLMAIGIDGKTFMRTRGHYDCLMSEARLTSFWAIASRQVPKSHWQRLSRAMLSTGFFGGAASYSGTMFEYFMPEIFIKSPEGSLFSESLKYALWVQKRYAKSLKRPYGISESGYFSFDPSLNYRYSAHGVPNTGIRRGLENSYVVSPYSTFISLSYSLRDGAENLRSIKDYGMYGSFGLYEALDFTAPDSVNPEPVRSYMSHHMGMSVLSADNVLGGGIMQKRFMSDLRVIGALELYDERFHLGTAVFENVLIRPRLTAPEPIRYETENITKISLKCPSVKLLHNGELTLLITDSGAVSAKYRSRNIYRTAYDLIGRPQGSFSYVSAGGETVSFGYLPDREGGGCVEFTEDAAVFYRNLKKLSAGMKLRILSDYPCELRTFALKNETNAPLSTSVFSYIDPSLQCQADERAHPAYSKMFLRLDRDSQWKLITMTRVRDGQKIWVGIGFIEDLPFISSFDRSEVLSCPDGLSGLKDSFLSIPPSLISEPDPCVFIRSEIELPPQSETEINMFVMCADSKEELINRVSAVRRKRLQFCGLPRLDTASGRVASALLPKILYNCSMPPLRAECVMKNRLPLTALWEISASTETPMVLVALNGRNDAMKLKAYLGAYKLLRLCGVEMQLVFAYDDGGRYERVHYNELTAAAREEGCEGSVYSPGGILPLDLKKARSGLWELCCAYACHICVDDIADGEEKRIEKKYTEVYRSEPDVKKVEIPVACGGFSGDSYVINEKTPLPWCHVLSNQVFGTLLSNYSLGFTYAFNSRENRLTPWDNDPERDNTGEKLLIEIGGKVYDLIKGSAAVFSFGKAEYFSKGMGYEAAVTVQVSERGMVKRVRVKVKTKESARIMYYAEPCMGVDRSCAGMIVPKKLENGITLYAPSSELQGYMTLICSQSAECMTDREGFLCGEYCDEVKPAAGLAVVVMTEVKSSADVDFYMSYALTEKASEDMYRYFSEQDPSGREHDDVNARDLKTGILAKWLRYQALHGRIYARTGFYQCSGAYGFRDQLQDACGLLGYDPKILKTQILRSCCSQFPEGDVLHWRHSLPNRKYRGIRTQISDDALWLVYAVCEYVSKTGDRSILELKVSYSDGITLSDGEKERYGEVYKTSIADSVYLHCKKALDLRAGKTGRHGLMLIGTGDWNDGFNEVGAAGEGESVWLTEFYIMTAERFAKISEAQGDSEYADALLEYAGALRESCEEYGRDAHWYLRGYFDSGKPLGSAKNYECRIDSIAQSFAQFSGLGRDGFAKEALLNAYEELYDPKRGIVKLFSPAFPDGAEPDPGYVRYYPEGLRENGGQYTHAAVWLAMALIQAGLEDEGKELLDALSPIRHSENGGYARYRTEPYYLCGDVYASKNCMGRGGWSIYTGAAAWMYRALTEGK